MLADHRDWLGRGDIVPRTPMILPIRSVEVFLDDLLPPRQLVPTAHGEIISDREKFTGTPLKLTFKQGSEFLHLASAAIRE
jgi:hypothetical protein